MGPLWIGEFVRIEREKVQSQSGEQRSQISRGFKRPSPLCGNGLVRVDEHVLPLYYKVGPIKQAHVDPTRKGLQLMPSEQDELELQDLIVRGYAGCSFYGCSGGIDPRGDVTMARDGMTVDYQVCSEHFEAVLGIIGIQVERVGTDHVDIDDEVYYERSQQYYDDKPMELSARVVFTEGESYGERKG